MNGKIKVCIERQFFIKQDSKINNTNWFINLHILDLKPYIKRIGPEENHVLTFINIQQHQINRAPFVNIVVVLRNIDLCTTINGAEDQLNVIHIYQNMRVFYYIW